MGSYSGLWDGQYGTPYALTVDRSSNHTYLARLLKQQDMFIEKRMVMSLLSATAILDAAAANVSSYYINNDSTAGHGVGNGGVREVKTVTRIPLGATVGAAGQAAARWVARHPTAAGRVAYDKSGNGRSLTGPLLGAV
jgi:hypothetical protein